MAIDLAVEPTVDTFHSSYESDWEKSLAMVRNMVVVALGCVKELSAQAVMKYNAPGMRIALGEIISCLSSAKKFTEFGRSLDLTHH